MPALTQIKNIKTLHAEKRQRLATLAVYAYKAAHDNPALLDLNYKQRDKYGYHQFLFDPKNEFDAYRAIIQSAFNLQNQDPEAEKIFNQLAAEHPHGVEIWVNPIPPTEKYNPKDGNEYPPRALYHPLVEREFLLSTDSVFTAAKTMLKDFETSQKQAENANQNQITSKCERIKSAIEEKYKETKEKINKLYDDKNLEFEYLKKSKFVRFFSRRPKSPEQLHYEEAEKALQDFQRFAVAQLAIAKRTDGQLPEKKDYKQTYLDLGEYEQQMKWDGLIKGHSLEDAESRQFNRDIFALDIRNENEDHTITEARLHYHDRHYTLTAQQVKLITKKFPEKFPEGAVIDPYQPQATATAHNVENVLANFALVDEGFYDKNQQNPVSVTLMTSRHGSPTPAVLYEKENIKNINRHETVYDAFLSMEQQLQALRTQVIQSILVPLLPDAPETLSEISRKLSYHINAEIHNRNLNNLNESNRNIIQKCIDQLWPEIDNKTGDLLKDNADAICNVQNLHTHLITAAGIGSGPYKQYMQFLDGRIAQYATQGKENGYIYMSNAINSLRYDAISFYFSRPLQRITRKLKGTNRVALIELYRNVEKYLEENQKIEITSNYDQALENTQKTAKLYVSQYETNPEDKELLQVKRNQFRLAETLLHKKAEDLNDQIYKTFKNIDIDSLKNGPEKRSEYLALKAYQIVQILFNERHWSGLSKWRLAKNNGLMQALVQLTAEQSGMFASSGCKSANDRELILALIISQLAENIEDQNYELNLDKATDEILEKAQAAYAWHISRHQSSLDRSSLPKTAASLLQYAAKILKEHSASKLSSHQRFEKQAAHIRKKQYKDFEDNSGVMLMRSLGTNNKNDRDYTIYFHFHHYEELRKISKTIDDQLQTLAIERGLSSQEKFLEYDTLKKACQSQKNYPLIKDLLNVISRRQFELRAEHASANQDIQNTQQYKDLNIFLRSFKGVINKKELTGGGMGLQKIREIVDELELNKQYSFYKLTNIFYQLREVAMPRVHDWTQSFASSHRGFINYFFKEKRPIWLQQLYQNLANADWGKENFSFDSITENIPELKSDENDILLQHQN